MGKKVEGLEGYKSNLFTVIKRSDKRDSGGSVYWECQCECGNIKLYVSHVVRNTMPLSCGCIPFKEDLRGRKFNEFTVLEVSNLKDSEGKSLWECRCSCGKIKHYRTFQVKKHLSCGCLDNPYRVEKASGVIGNLTKDFPVEHYTWQGMKERCNNPNHPSYDYYGGRGIKVCNKWKYDFREFLKDMGPKPHKDLSIERVDNNGNYEPGNCVWADSTTQVLNRRMNKNNTSGVTGVSKTPSGSWASVVWVNYKNIYLGTFDNFDDAVSARKEAEVKYYNKKE